MAINYDQRNLPNLFESLNSYLDVYCLFPISINSYILKQNTAFIDLRKIALTIAGNKIKSNNHRNKNIVLYRLFQNQKALY